MKRALSFLMSAVLMLSLVSAASAEVHPGAKPVQPEPTPAPERVTISSLNDFLDFASACTETAYSENKIFSLTCNIDLTDTDFEPIPYFSGTFEGNNYRISGLNIDRGGSRRGLFRILSEKASVSDLKVYGSVVPTGTRVYVGGLAGINLGAIRNCSFEGTVEGIENVGGIAGICGDSASVIGCTVKGNVSGEHSVGGIAGSSTGTITACTCSAEVNTKSVTPEKTDGFDLSSFDVASIAVDDFLDITDLGGICGRNGGTISGCTNNGDVGYHYTGYNVGGIAGTDSGYVSACLNKGTVLGRKDVGGIVGQQVPYVEIDLSEGKFDDIEAAIVSLNGQIAAASESASLNGTIIDLELGNLAGATDAFATELKKLFEQLQGREDDIAQRIHINPETGEISFDGLEPVDTSALGNAIANMYAEYKLLFDLVNTAAKDMAGALTGVASSMSHVMGSLNNAMKGTNFDIDEFEISVDEGYDHDRGAVDKCINRGDVKAENCAGGITGTIAYELAFDQEDLIDASHYIVSEVKEFIFAVIRDSESYGRIETKNDNVGGIVGIMDLGAVLNSTGAGYITSLNGGYVGGIAGNSAGTVKNCWARTVLSGDGYVGGIAGNGENILDCCVYAAFENYGEYAGALAGWSEGTLSENYYVSCSPAGVDGISYTGKMFAVSYDELLKKENLPSVFKEIKVRFIGPGGNVLQTDTVEFGAAVTEFPVVPFDGVKYWIWDWEGLDAVYHSVDVKGAYYSPVSTLSTGEDVPRFLVEGTFYDGQELRVTETVSDSSSGSVTASTVEVTSYGGELTVRMFAEGTGKVWVTHGDGTESDVPFTTDGRYKVFTIQNGESVRFEEIPVKAIAAGMILAVVAGAVGLIVLIVLLKRKRKNTPGETPETESEEPASAEVSPNTEEAPQEQTASPVVSESNE